MQNENKSLNLSRAQVVGVISVVVLTKFFVGFVVTLMSIALPGVAKDFHVSVAEANWIVLIYAIVAATIITTGARFLHKFGFKILMFTATGCMALGGVIGFFAANYMLLILARIFHAISAGLIYPTANTAIMKVASKKNRTFALSLSTAAGGFGFALSPFLSGLILTNFGVNAMFLPTAFMGILCFVASIFLVHPIGERESKSAKVDALSVVLAFFGLGFLMFGISEINHQILLAFMLIGVGVVLLLIFAHRQNHLAVPLLNLTPLTNKVFLVGILLLMFSSLAEHALRLVMPLYLEGAVSFTASEAGLFMLGPQLAYAISAMIAGKLNDRFGVWPLVPAGFAVIVVGLITIWALADASVNTVMLLMVIVLVVLGGVGSEGAPTREVAYSSLEEKTLAAGSAISSVFVQIASALSSALMVGFFTNDVAAKVKTGISEKVAYASGFEATMLLTIGIEVVVFIVSIVFALKNKHSVAK